MLHEFVFIIQLWNRRTTFFKMAHKINILTAKLPKRQSKFQYYGIAPESKAVMWILTTGIKPTAIYINNNNIFALHHSDQSSDRRGLQAPVARQEVLRMLHNNKWLSTSPNELIQTQGRKQIIGGGGKYVAYTIRTRVWY
jgi:hypothetical protein